MSTSDNIKLQNGWQHLLEHEFISPYMQELKQFLISEKQAGKTIFPK